MSVWGQIITTYSESLQKKDRVKVKSGLAPTKKCPACGKMKARDEFYPRPTHSPNALSSKCKACSIRLNNIKDK